MSARVCFVVGARPNFMKAAPVLPRAAQRSIPRSSSLLVHTGQHYDAEMSDVFLRELGLPEPDVFLGVGSGSHAEQTAQGPRRRRARSCSSTSPDLVVVAGRRQLDARRRARGGEARHPGRAHRGGPAQLRPAMPEEHNRMLTDHLSDVLLAHSESAIDNLAARGDRPRAVAPRRQHDDRLAASRTSTRPRAAAAVGELGLAAGRVRARHAPPAGARRRPGAADATVTTGSIALARERTRSSSRCTRGRSHTWSRAGVDARLARLAACSLTAPLGYLDFLGLRPTPRFVLTDSGGVQEETSALGVRCFTLRDSTERPVTVELGTNTLLGATARADRRDPALLEQAQAAREVIPLWDGAAGPRAAEVLYAGSA